ncbi:LXG domain-containing protein [Heyndrickxia coagulans]|uniref:LXG domain-containing protein n=1 Tax=Heyndrickxia coagulans TaxID=1398 RepID=UPI002235720F|nr:LXG domain-containing protein [Heyndrickxia coagulans]UZH07800.1 LXG domain-containing protein [Heyndrickxia coagulans]
MKVEFEELLHLQKEIDRSTKEMAARLEVVRQKTNAISRLQSFKGKAADSAKHYFHTTHGEMIETLVTAARQVQHRYNQIISEFEGTVDDSPGAVLHADYMHDLNQKTRILKNQMMDIYHEGLQVLHSISDIVSIPAPDLGHFIESAEASQKFANEVNEKLHAFDRKALQIVEESRRDVDRVMKKVMEAGERSLVGGGQADCLNDNDSSLHEQQVFVDKLAIFILMSNGFKAMQRTYKYINKSNTLLIAAIQFYIY